MAAVGVSVGEPGLQQIGGCGWCIGRSRLRRIWAIGWRRRGERHNLNSWSTLTTCLLSCSILYRRSSTRLTYQIPPLYLNVNVAGANSLPGRMIYPWRNGLNRNRKWATRLSRDTFLFGCISNKLQLVQPIRIALTECACLDTDIPTRPRSDCCICIIAVCVCSSFIVSTCTLLPPVNETSWPATTVRDHVRTIGYHVIRSEDRKAVFDLASHYRTNPEAPIEILTLGQCQSTVHWFRPAVCVRQSGLDQHWRLAR